jgi:hypothetical protein
VASEVESLQHDRSRYPAPEVAPQPVRTERTGCHTGAMADPDAVLSSIATSVDELMARVVALAQTLDHEPTAAAAADLFEAERALRNAGRRVARARGRLA